MAVHGANPPWVAKLHLEECIIGDIECKIGSIEPYCSADMATGIINLDEIPIKYIIRTLPCKSSILFYF